MARTTPPVPDWLLGRWHLQRADETLEILPGTRMDFRDGGELLYAIELEGKHAVFELTYSVVGDMLHTEHAAGGHATSARISLESSGLLQFDFGGRRAWFVRERLM